MPIPELKRLGVQELADLNERFEYSAKERWLHLVATASNS